MDVRLPDGTVIQNVPDGTTKADLVTKLKGNGMAVPSEWLDASAPPAAPTDRQNLLASVPMRLAKGMKDPIDAAAQLVQRVLPDRLVNADNSAANAIGGEGTFTGDVLGIKGASPDQLTADIRGSNQEYEAARKATGQTGTDLVRLAGNVVSPVNAAVGRVLPVPAIGNSIPKLALKGATAGAAGAVTQPVMTDDFWTDKAKQAGVGALTGALLTPALTKASESVARYVTDKMRNGAINKTPEAIQLELKASLAQDDIDIGQIPKIVLDKMTAEAQQALSSGREIDAPSLLRKMDFDRVGVQPLLGQVTRNPTQYARELDLRGIQGVGEPIANRLNEQQGVIASKFRQGAAGAKNPYEAGQSLVAQLQSKDKEMAGDVRAAYQAFRDSTGKELPVPLDPMKEGYAATLKDFGDTIPSAVRKQFYEILSGPKVPHSHGATSAPETARQLAYRGYEEAAAPVVRTLSIDDAERLIKTINKNYNPADQAQAKALDELRGHVQNAIIGATDTGAGMEAATLANFARGKASERFSAIDSAPALKAAINSAEPDDFVRKYVINGKVRELNKMAELLGADGQKTMQQQMMSYLQKKAFGANAAGDGSGKQASLNDELTSIGKNKLEAILGPQQTDDLFAIGRVMAYIQQRPAGSAVNESNTGAAVANMLSKIVGKVKGSPYIHDIIVKPIASFQERGQVKNALAAQLPETAAQLDPQTVNRLARIMGPVPQSAGTALGYSVR